MTTNPPNTNPNHFNLPWTAEWSHGHNGEDWYWVIDSNKKIIAEEMTEEHARLLAGAPDLLIVARLALNYIGTESPNGYTEIIDYLKDAIQGAV